MKRTVSLGLFLLMATCLFAQAPVEEDLDLQYATEMLKKGSQVPDFTLDDINGKPVNIKDFRGRKLVLFFWASWCPDCRAEVPQLKEMQATADPYEVAFVSVSFDKTFDAFKTYVNENYLGGVQLFDPAGKKESKVAADCHIKWIPSLYVIDADGKVILGTVMADKVAKAIAPQSIKPTIGKKELCSDENCSNN